MSYHCGVSRHACVDSLYKKANRCQAKDQTKTLVWITGIAPQELFQWCCWTWHCFFALLWPSHICNIYLTMKNIKSFYSHLFRQLLDCFHHALFYPLKLGWICNLQLWDTVPPFFACSTGFSKKRHNLAATSSLNNLTERIFSEEASYVAYMQVDRFSKKNNEIFRRFIKIARL